MTRRWAARAALLLAALALGALSPEARAQQPARRDALGREVALPATVRRIVSLAPSVTETLFALGAQELIVAVSKSCDYPVEAKLKPRAGDFNTPDLEKVRALAPDVVLFAEYARPADLEALGRAGVPAFVVPGRTVEDVTASIRDLGAIVGKPAAAEKIVSGIADAVREVAGRVSAVPEASRPRVYVEVDGPGELYAVGPGSFMDTIVAIAGGRNVFADRGQAYFPVSSEEVIARNPEVVLVDYPFQYKVGVSKRPGWDAVAAVRGGRVYDGTDFDIIVFNRPGPRIVQALREIAALLHPDLFRGR